jgi:hypothetical protein
MICPTGKMEIFRKGLDRENQIERIREIRFLAQKLGHTDFPRSISLL